MAGAKRGERAVAGGSGFIFLWSRDRKKIPVAAIGVGIGSNKRGGMDTHALYLS